MPRALLLLFVLLSVDACAPAQAAPAGPERPVLTIRVSNPNIGMRLYLESDGVREPLGSLDVGSRTVRIPRRLNGSVLLVAEESQGSRDFVTRWYPGGEMCWTWEVPRVGNVNATFPVPCRPRRDEAGAWVRTEQYAQEARYLGFTRWDDETLTPYAFINRRVIGTAWEAEVVAHEDVHLRQFSRFRTLADLRAAAERDAMAWEAEAFCRQAEAAVLSGRIATIEQAVAEMAFNLASPNYGFGIDVASAAGLILRNCRAT